MISAGHTRDRSSTETTLSSVYMRKSCTFSQCNFCRAEFATSCDFIAFLVQFVSAKRQCTSISKTKAVRLLKSETAAQSHRVS